MSTEKPVPAEGSLLTPICIVGYVFHGKNRNEVWDCRCKCGKIHAVIRGRIISGKCKSCGCLRRERGRKTAANAREGKRLKKMLSK